MDGGWKKGTLWSVAACGALYCACESCTRRLKFRSRPASSLCWSRSMDGVHRNFRNFIVRQDIEIVDIWHDYQSRAEQTSGWWYRKYRRENVRKLIFPINSGMVIFSQWRTMNFYSCARASRARRREYFSKIFCKYIYVLFRSLLS